MLIPDESPESDALSERAYRRVREGILAGEYGFGAIINRRELATELGMSLVPVNQAMVRLENEYLIENLPRVGTKVRTPTPQDIRGFWAIREALETQAARIFSRVARDRDREALIELAKQVDAAHVSATRSDQPDPKSLYQFRCVHMAFHNRIAEGARLPFFAREVEKNQLLVFNWFYVHELYGGSKLPAHWHEELARTLKSCSEAEADAAMREHIHNRLDELLQRLEQFFLFDEASLARWTNHAAPPRSMEPASSAEKT